MKTKLIISINDGYVEYSMPLEVDDSHSVFTAALRIRSAFENPPPTVEDLVCRTNTSYIALVKSTIK